MLTLVGYIIFVGSMDLYGWVLRIDLSFNEALQSFWYPGIKTDLAIYGGNLKTKMFLDAAAVFKLRFVAKNTVKAGEKLLVGKLRLVVRCWNLQ